MTKFQTFSLTTSKVTLNLMETPCSALFTTSIFWIDAASAHVIKARDQIEHLLLIPVLSQAIIKGLDAGDRLSKSRVILGEGSKANTGLNHERLKGYEKPSLTSERMMIFIGKMAEREGFEPSVRG